ncbi:MAG: uridine diphosphate-N-acetylglucosamine-binding protein YvcK [Acidobacteria bacterium]|nr:uridine diphosphate-N-acetylglucosamine-binding protein YvcK [Acidobacteriota bacterium]
MRDTELLVEPLLQQLEEEYEGLQVAAIGGGHGLSAALRAILHYADAVTAIVTVADDGGSSGRIAPGLEIPPPGDIRRALLAMTDQPSLWRSLIEYRFSNSDVAGHSLGNLILAAMAELGGGFSDAVNTVGRLLGARGAVIPVAAEGLTLEADVDGVVVRGQVAIARSRGSITDLRAVPDVEASRSAIEAIAAADQIVLGPGSLFTSVIAPLRVGDMAAAITESKATLIYVCNLTTQDGETFEMSGAEHIEALVSIAGIRIPDVVIAHDGPLMVPDDLERVELDLDRMAEAGVRLEFGDIVRDGSDWPEHDPPRLGAVLRRLSR